LILAILNGVRIENPNIEIRNPKQYQNPNVQIPRDRGIKQTSAEAVVLPFLIIPILRI
jgi:hypothetical protein